MSEDKPCQYPLLIVLSLCEPSVDFKNLYIFSAYFLSVHNFLSYYLLYSVVLFYHADGNWIELVLRIL